MKIRLNVEPTEIEIARARGEALAQQQMRNALH